MLQNVSIELRYTSFTAWGYGISDYYSYNADKKILEKVSKLVELPVSLFYKAGKYEQPE